jgi:hypothetical protein
MLLTTPSLLSRATLGPVRGLGEHVEGRATRPCNERKDETLSFVLELGKRLIG